MQLIDSVDIGTVRASNMKILGAIKLLWRQCRLHPCLRPHTVLSPWACVRLLSLFSLVLLCDPTDSGPPGSSFLGILQARILVWVARPSSRVSSQPRVRTHVFYVSCVSCIGRGILYHWCHLGSPPAPRPHPPRQSLHFPKGN